MKKTFRAFVATVVVASLSAIGSTTAHATIGYVGSHYDMTNNFPGGDDAGHYVISPWRSEGFSKPLDIDGNNVYGTDGYALFATQFNWKNVSCCGSNPPVDSATYPNLIDLPSYVADSKFLVNNKVGVSVPFFL